MSLYAIADLHLAVGEPKKRMDVFGGRWKNYLEKIKNEWENTVGEDDTVVIAGDFSWAMTVDEGIEDFRFIDSLPGKKLLIEGNHDFWWQSLKKMEDFCSKNNFGYTFLRCNSIRAEEYVICGSRGWYTPDRIIPENNADSSAIVAREAIRLDMSLTHAEKNSPDLKKAVFLHFPPVFGTYVCPPLIEVLKKHNVTQCFFGHIHGIYDRPLSFVHDGIVFNLIAADALNFKPYKIFI